MTPLPQLLATLGYLLLPVMVGAIGHTFFVRGDLLPGLKKPLSTRLFGANKTLRGFVVVPALVALATYLVVPLERLWSDLLLGSYAGGPRWAYGLALGFVYMLFELPNSFLKRRLGIPPGKRPGRHKLLFVFLDQMDSALGVLLLCVLLFQLPLDVLLLGLALGVALHWVCNMGLYAVGLRKELV